MTYYLFLFLCRLSYHMQAMYQPSSTQTPNILRCSIKVYVHTDDWEQLRVTRDVSMGGGGISYSL